MERITVTSWEIGSDLPHGNKILGSLPEKRGKIKVVFQGENNLLFFENGISGVKSLSVTFKGSNSVVYLSKNRHVYNMILRADGNNTCLIGKNLFNNNVGPLRIVLSEGDDMMIGNDCLFSVNIRMESNGGDILLGDHVWLGHGVRIKRGVTIESGAVIGSGAVIADDTTTDIEKSARADTPAVALEGNACWITKNGKMQKTRDSIVYTTESLRKLSMGKLREYDSIHPKTLAEILALTETTDFSPVKMTKDICDPSKRLEIIADSAERRSYKLPEHRTPSVGSLLRKIRSKAVSKAFGGENRIEGLTGEQIANASIVFEGKGNALIVEEGADLADSRFRFIGNGSVIYICRSSHPYNIVGQVHHGTKLFIGPDNRFDEKRKTRIAVSEARTVLIGSGCMFGKDVWIRTSDQHAIYDIATRERLNYGRDVMIGSGGVFPDGHVIIKGTNTATDEDESAAFKNTAITLSSLKSTDEAAACLKELARMY